MAEQNTNEYISQWLKMTQKVSNLQQCERSELGLFSSLKIFEFSRQKSTFSTNQAKIRK